MNKPSNPKRTRTLTLSELRAVAGGETTLSTIAKNIRETSNTVIQNIRG